MSRQVLHTLLALVVSGVALLATAGNDAVAVDTAASETGQQAGMELNIVKAAPMSKAELANQPQGQSEPGVGKTGEQKSTPILLVSLAGWTAYVDPIYGFRINYPNGFIVQPQDVSKLAQFTPTPVASIFFMNPIMAAGDLAGIEPPDLQVRVYQAGAVDSLENWLNSVGFASASSGVFVHPYQNASVSGLKVCQSAEIAPSCAVYVLGSGRVYQLTPISLEGEAMIETFALLLDALGQRRQLPDFD
jgi:hypothetical protein